MCQNRRHAVLTLPEPLKTRYRHFLRYPSTKVPSFNKVPAIRWVPFQVGTHELKAALKKWVQSFPIFRRNIRLALMKFHGQVENRKSWTDESGGRTSSWGTRSTGSHIAQHRSSAASGGAAASWLHPNRGRWRCVTSTFSLLRHTPHSLATTFNQDLRGTHKRTITRKQSIFHSAATEGSRQFWYLERGRNIRELYGLEPALELAKLEQQTKGIIWLCVPQLSERAKWN